MSETARLIELALETEGLLRILAARDSKEARQKLRQCIEELRDRTEAYLAEVPEDKPCVSFELDEPLSIRELLTPAMQTRFRDSIFHGNADDFDDTIGILSDMSSYGEAEDYLLNDMMWNRDDADVSEFLGILSANMPR